MSTDGFVSGDFYVNGDKVVVSGNVVSIVSGMSLPQGEVTAADFSGYVTSVSGALASGEVAAVSAQASAFSGQAAAQSGAAMATSGLALATSGKAIATSGLAQSYSGLVAATSAQAMATSGYAIATSGYAIAVSGDAARISGDAALNSGLSVKQVSGAYFKSGDTITTNQVAGAIGTLYFIPSGLDPGGTVAINSTAGDVNLNATSGINLSPGANRDVLINNAHVFRSGDAILMSGQAGSVPEAIAGGIYFSGQNAGYPLNNNGYIIKISGATADLWTSGLVTTTSGSPVISPASGSITIRDNGYYDIYAGINLQWSNANGMGLIQVRKNGVLISGSMTLIQPNANAVADYGSAHAVEYCVSGDELTVFISGTNYEMTGRNGNFRAIKLGGLQGPTGPQGFMTSGDVIGIVSGMNITTNAVAAEIVMTSAQYDWNIGAGSFPPAGFYQATGYVTPNISVDMAGSGKITVLTSGVYKCTFETDQYFASGAGVLYQNNFITINGSTSSPPPKSRAVGIGDETQSHNIQVTKIARLVSGDEVRGYATTVPAIHSYIYAARLEVEKIGD